MSTIQKIWLLEQGVRATGYVRAEGERNRRLDSFVFSIGNLVEHCRSMLRERILRALPGKQYAGVIVALVVGDQRSIDQSDWMVFNSTKWPVIGKVKRAEVFCDREHPAHSLHELDFASSNAVRYGRPR